MSLLAIRRVKRKGRWSVSNEKKKGEVGHQYEKKRLRPLGKLKKPRAEPVGEEDGVALGKGKRRGRAGGVLERSVQMSEGKKKKNERADNRPSTRAQNCARTSWAKE